MHENDGKVKVHRHATSPLLQSDRCSSRLSAHLLRLFFCWCARRDGIVCVRSFVPPAAGCALSPLVTAAKKGRFVWRLVGRREHCMVVRHANPLRCLLSGVWILMGLPDELLRRSSLPSLLYTCTTNAIPPPVCSLVAGALMDGWVAGRWDGILFQILLVDPSGLVRWVIPRLKERQFSVTVRNADNKPKSKQRRARASKCGLMGRFCLLKNGKGGGAWQ